MVGLHTTFHRESAGERILKNWASRKTTHNRLHQARRTARLRCAYSCPQQKNVSIKY